MKTDVTPDHQKVDPQLSQPTTALEDYERFTYIISHDLQEPLRMVAAFTELLEKRYSNILDDKGKKFTHYAHDGAKRMQAMLDDLLFLSRINSKGNPFTEVDFNEVITNTIAFFEVEINNQNIMIDLGEFPTLLADNQQMHLLFKLLLNNAIQFHDPERKLKISIHSYKQNNNYQFDITDNGIGIEEKNWQRIFDVFQKIEPDNKTQNSGMGLAVCKAIIQRHQGVIDVISRPDIGSTFSFILPTT